MPGTVEISRDPGGWVDRWVTYRIAIDGRVTDEIRRGESKSFHLEDGEHELQLFHGKGPGKRLRSPVIPIWVLPDAPLRLRCGPMAKFGVSNYFYVAAPDLWIRIEEDLPAQSEPTDPRTAAGGLRTGQLRRTGMSTGDRVIFASGISLGALALGSGISAVAWGSFAAGVGLIAVVLAITSILMWRHHSLRGRHPRS